MLIDFCMCLVGLFTVYKHSHPFFKDSYYIDEH